jgi:drug/metabolite transporter (DMT)-like permease
MSKKTVLYLKLVLVTLFWGGTFLTGQITSKAISPALGAFGRFAVASIFLTLTLFLRERKLPRPDSKQVVLIIAAAATGIVAYNLFFFSGLKLIETNRASLIVALNPVVIMSMAALIGIERLNLRRVIGIIVALLGVAIVLTRGELTEIQANVGRGELFILGCVLSWSLFTMIGRQRMDGLSPLVITTYASIIGSIGLLIPAASQLPELVSAGWPVWLSIAYLGVFGTGLGFVWYYDGVREIGPTRAGIFINLVPVWAMLLGVLFLNEEILTATLLGGAFIIVGVTITNLAHSRKRKFS